MNRHASGECHFWPGYIVGFVCGALIAFLLVAIR